MNKKHKNIPLIIFILLSLVTFICINITIRLLNLPLKFDMTTNQRYSISQASKDIINSLTSPIQIRLYLSNSLSQENPAYASYAQFVVRYLRKYQQIAGTNRIKIEIIDPKPFSPEEEEAKKSGIKALTDSSGQSNLYFGAVISNALGKSAVIPNFIPSRSGYLETDISRLLAKLNTGTHKNIGLISPQLPLITHAYGRAIPNWAIVAQIQNDYNIVELSDKTAHIPGNIDVLLVINPEKMTPLFTYALDQYILRGGKLIIISDIFSEKQASDKGTVNATSADMNNLLKNWGIYMPQEVVGDRELGEITLISSSNTKQAKNFPYWLQLGSPQINQAHPATHGLNHLRFKTSGAVFALNDNPQIKFTPLLTTEEHANLVGKGAFATNSQAELENLFKEGNQKYILAAEIEGKFPSLFRQNIFANTKYEKKIPTFLPYSIAQGKIIILADSDFIVAENWADTSSTINNPVYGLAPLFDNGTLLLRLMDYLTGKNDLLGLQNTESQNIKTVGENIYTTLFNQYADTYSQAQYELAQRQALSQTYPKKLQQTFTPLTAQQIKEMETNTQRIQELQQEINKISYQIKEGNIRQINTIIRHNIIYIPGVIILLVLLIYLLLQKRTQKRIEEKANEFKAN